MVLMLMLTLTSAHKTPQGTRLQVEAGDGVRALIASTMPEVWGILETGLVEEGKVDDVSQLWASKGWQILGEGVGDIWDPKLSSDSHRLLPFPTTANSHPDPLLASRLLGQDGGPDRRARKGRSQVRDSRHGRPRRAGAPARGLAPQAAPHEQVERLRQGRRRG